VVVAMALAVLAGTAHAQSADEAKAKALFDEGTQHFNLAEYDEAIVAYKEAYRLLPDPLFLFNIAQAYRQDGDCGKARTFYKSYLREAPDAYNREKVEQRIVEMEECIRATGAVPEADPPVVVEKPKIEPEVTKEPEPRPVVVDRPAPRRGGTQRIAGIAAAGVGVALLGTGGYFSWRAGDIASRLEADCADGGCDGAAVIASNADGKAADRNAAILYVAGGVGVAAGAVLYYLGWSAGRESSIAIAPTSGGATIVGAWTW
jgi:tetratricopeptide (TPR) repeat protein